MVALSTIIDHNSAFGVRDNFITLGAFQIDIILTLGLLFEKSQLKES